MVSQAKGFKKSMGALLIAVAFTVVGCDKSADSASEDSDVTESNLVEGITAQLVTDKTGVDDKSFNASAWAGITRFFGDTADSTTLRGINYDTVAAPSQDQYNETLRTVSELENDLVIATGFTWAGALDLVSAEYPEQKYLIIDVGYLENSAKNVLQAVFAEQEAGFLAGLATALKAQEDGIENPSFGFIGGVPGDVITRFQVGYIQGIRTIFPEAEVLDYYANDWAKPDLAKTKANQWYDAGVYAIFTAAGSTGNGTIQAAKEARLAGKNVWAIGVDSDQYAEGLYDGDMSAVLTSAVKRVDIAVEQALQDVESEIFDPSRVLIFDMNMGGVSLPEENPNLSEEILAEIKIYEEQVISGTLAVDATVADFTAPGHLGEGMELLAVDD